MIRATTMRRKLVRSFLAGTTIAGALTGFGGSASAWHYEPLMDSPAGAKGCQDEKTKEWYLDGMKVLMGNTWYLCRNGQWLPA